MMKTFWKVIVIIVIIIVIVIVIVMTCSWLCKTLVDQDDEDFLVNFNIFFSFGAPPCCWIKIKNRDH